MFIICLQSCSAFVDSCTHSHTSAMFPSIVRKQRTAGFSLFLLQWHRSGLHTSPGKESACNAGDSSSIPVLARSPGEGIGYLLQYSWVSLLTQMVKNTLATQETWVQSLGWEDPLERGKATHCSILAWRIPWTV